MEKTYTNQVIDLKSDRLRDIKKALKLTKKEFSQLLWVDPTNITKYERGTIPIGKSLKYRPFGEQDKNIEV